MDLCDLHLDVLVHSSVGRVVCCRWWCPVLLFVMPILVVQELLESLVSIGFFFVVPAGRFVLSVIAVFRVL